LDHAASTAFPYTAPRARARRPATAAPLAYRVNDAAAAIGISRSKVWDLIAQGQLPARKLVGSTIILRADLETYLSALPPARPTST
jgi:excisionase family DNA binding protein